MPKEIYKVVRLALQPVFEKHRNEDGSVEELNNQEYREALRNLQEELENLQQCVSRAKNRTIQIYWQSQFTAKDTQDKQNQSPKQTKKKGPKSTQGKIYNQLKDEFPDMYSSNLSCAIRSAGKAFNNAKQEMAEGTRSVMSYRADCPIEIHNDHINFLQGLPKDQEDQKGQKVQEDKENQKEKKDQKFYVSLALFSGKYAREHANGTHRVFELYRLGGSQQAIVTRCMSREYTIGESELIYNKKKRQWFLNLTYRFEAEQTTVLDPEKIMGVDLGIKCVAYMGFNFCDASFSIGTSEVDAFRANVEARKHALQQQGKYCGDGRIGHGYATRNKPVLQISDAIHRFRDTANHKYSRYIVQRAVEYGCGTIQMEDLSGIRNVKDEKFLADWTYYDLQQKIRYKAEAYGIAVKFVSPRYTSQRCHRCGWIDQANRPYKQKGQAYFCCQKCKLGADGKLNADYNASRNLAIKDIDKIITKELSAKRKCTQ